MPSTKEYLEFVLEQLSDLQDISYRYMMGEYIIYYQGKIAGGIFDDRLLIKPVNSAIEFIKNPTYEIPFKGAKQMILIDDLDNKEFLNELFKTIYKDLEFPKPKTKRKKTSK